MATIIKSVSVSLELQNLLEKFNISPSEAFRVGASVILSEMGEPQYLNKLNIGRKIYNLSQIIREQQERLNVLEQKE